MPTTDDEIFMAQAIQLSRDAAAHGNEPFGALLVRDGEVIATNENQIYTAHDYTFHAEAGLIRTYCAQSGEPDLSDCTLYSSCEPCYMCSGAMVWSRVGRLVYGASDIDLCSLVGEPGSPCSETVFEHSHHAPEVTAGVLRDEALEVLRAYFEPRGEKN
ncbi:nucleoside deaminase [Olsenella sp. YH-ols2217]|uniref:Nucleoside deaminase n=1 Tax=Kribbibacterium absianum TaxID=3044210 RepID=A0ABT6ZI10_9ACTN|nr:MULTISPECIES: nucleoside deaminase [unclassified Olsenella]MDJ1121202.1 nucleoside deaminase [Olsenella sp. YH-ols2216]MDJ1128693.1 nucleoside deaminase [Olsenella sp. YH-ols2217]